jgi:phosphate starvation-inducible protein PhoH and related proteins
MSKRRSQKHQNNQIKSIRKRLKAKTENQRDYILDISESDVTICTGPAGTGKTAVAVGLASEYILNKKVEKIIITRPVVEVGTRGLGFLPGSLNEKMQPWVVPLLEEMNAYLSKETVNSMRASNTIELAPLEYMRGRTFDNSFMILDEAQNCTFEQIRMFLTRIGQDSKMVINGDIEQTDLHQQDNALSECAERLEGVRGVSICELAEQDIIRNSIISRILSRLK